MTESVDSLPGGAEPVSVVEGRKGGVFAPVVTPFSADLSVNVPAWLRHCRWILSQGAGLAIFGTNSEAASLSTVERRALLEVVSQTEIDPFMLMPGTGACALPEAVELSEAATALGVRGVLMVPPFYFKNVSDDGLFGFYSEVIERVGHPGLRLYLYHIPQFSGVPISVPLMQRLKRAYPDVIAGVKDSSGDWDGTARMLAELPDLEVYPGSESFLLAALRRGGAGCISATANINPGPISRLWREWRSDGADALQGDLDAVRRVIQSHPMIPALKSAIADATGDEGWTRLRPPLTRLGADHRTDLAGALRAASFAMPQLSPTV